MRAIGENVDLGPGIGPHQSPGGAQPFGQAVGQIVGLHRADGRGHAIVLARERHQHLGLHARVDHHDLGTLAELPQQAQRGPLRLDEARPRHVGGLHGGGAVDHERDPLRPLPHHVHRRPGQRHREGQQGEDLQNEERVALQALEEGRGFPVAERGIPQQQARDPHLPAPHLQEIEEEQRHRQRGHQESERTQEVHARRSPFSWRSMNSSTGVSVTTRW
jgi:hypothetical protein